MSDKQLLDQIACKFVDAYCTLDDIKRPLTDEQIKDAGVLFLDLI